MALISPSHHSTTQTGIAEQWVGEKTIPGRCVLLLFGGVVFCCCCLLLGWCWGGVVVWCIGAKWSPLLADNTQDRVNQFGTLCVMSFCTVIACTGLSKDWRNWKPYKHSQPSASLRTTSKTKSINLVPVYPKTKLFSLKGWSKGVHQNGTLHVAVSHLGVPRTNCFVEARIASFKLTSKTPGEKWRASCAVFSTKNQAVAHTS